MSQDKNLPSANTEDANLAKENPPRLLRVIPGSLLDDEDDGPPFLPSYPADGAVTIEEYLERPHFFVNPDEEK
jgi:hypothetical protein